MSELVGQCVNQGGRRSDDRSALETAMEKKEKEKWERNGRNVSRYLPLNKANDVRPN